MSKYFEYSDKEILYLKSRDEKLAKAIDVIGYIERRVNPDFFSSIVNTIVGQQISTKAQQTIWRRMNDKLIYITPDSINSLSTEELQQFGISFCKAGYIKGAAEMIQSDAINIDSLTNMCDSDVIKTLTKIPGVGVWSAEMLMLFTMQRPDIISFGDLGIHRGMKMLYGHDEITKDIFAKYKNQFSPCGSVASLYLWSISSGKYEL